MGPAPLSCPRCGGAAQPSPGPQRCAACGGAFALYVGAALDPSVPVPAPNPHAPIVKVRSAGLATHRFGVIEPLGVAEGELDPIVATMQMDKAGVAWGDVCSISVWRAPDWVELVAALLVPVPLGLLLLVLAVTVGPGFAFGGLPFALLGAFMVYRAVVRQRHYARVVGRYRTVTIRFDRPGWRRELFHNELLRRAGLPPAPIP